MRLVNINIEKYKEVVNRLAGDEFLQTTYWRDLLNQENEEVEIFGLEKEASAEILASILIIKKKLFSSFFYYYAPRGPRGDAESGKLLLLELKKAKPEAIFFRIEPTENNLITSLAAEKLNIKKTLDLQPKKTLYLDLNLNEEDLLNKMHPKTRYNIRLAEKKGVKIKLAGIEDFNHFWELMEKTGERDGFRLHSRAHYANLLAAENKIKMFLAEYEGRVIAGGLFSFFGGRVTYLHGASDNEHRNLMAPYLLQWTVIKEAQKINRDLSAKRDAPFSYYDFYGIDENKWPGVTRFKLGFSGYIKEYPGTYDIIFKTGIYNLYETLRYFKRMLKV